MHMSGESLLVIIVVGVIAGWLAGQIVQGTGFGLVGDFIIGSSGPSLEVGSCRNSVSTLVRAWWPRLQTRRSERYCCWSC